MSTPADKPKLQGTVKWFSNKKGYGFITPAEGSPTSADVFVHQSSIHSDGYRTLDEGWVVEFTIGDDDGGRIKAENVTGPGGGPCTGPRKHRTNRRREHEEHHEEDHPAVNGGGRRRRNDHGGSRGRRNQPRTNKPTEAHWHASLNPNVKNALETKGIRAATGTIDVSVGSARVKLGTGGYSSVAHADGILAEGTFSCDSEGNATMQWDKCIAFKDGAWVLVENESRLVTALSLADDKVVAVQPDETSTTLWGDGPTEPREALEANGFLMRRVVLTPRKGGGR